MENEFDKYKEIRNRTKRKQSARRRISDGERACQFAPFAALTGFGEVIAEQSRTTERKIELDEYEIEKIDMALRTALCDDLPVLITYFIPDERKSGGEYVTRRVRLNEINPITATVTTDTGLVIPMKDILSVTYS